ncbi:MAG TPA: DUF4157 domain-containing protein [Hyphomonadaceae bacterium]
MLRTSFALAAAALLATTASAQETQSRRGLLSNAASGVVLSTAQYGANIISGTLESALKRSRDAARADSKPIPDEIREALMPFYPSELLENVRYSIGDTTPGGVAGFAIRNGNAAAVTLIDTVVFSSETHLRNLALWAHELHHVEQYKDWGIGGFASRYAFNWQDVEAEATSRAHSFVAWYKERTGQN